MKRLTDWATEYDANLGSWELILGMCPVRHVPGNRCYACGWLPAVVGANPWEDREAWRVEWVTMNAGTDFPVRAGLR